MLPGHPRHRFFNTNNLWVDLQALATTLRGSGGVLELPLIVNAKTVDPKDAASTPVVQLETAMGAAIDALDGALAIRVPRTRFGPVKTTNDLLAVRSDAYVLDEGRAWHSTRRAAACRPTSTWTRRTSSSSAELDAHFPAGPPSLVACERLVVERRRHLRRRRRRPRAASPSGRGRMRPCRFLPAPSSG